MRPLLLVSDCHLSPHRLDGTADQLARLQRSFPDAELILNGDTWDLSCETSNRTPGQTLYEWLEQTPRLRAAFTARLRRGVPIRIVAGNHDWELVQSSALEGLRSVLGVTSSAPLEITPSWLRRGDIHIEHGHVFDADNATSWSSGVEASRHQEPLGVALTRRFIAPNGAFAFAHAHEATPLRALSQAFLRFGPTTPRLVIRYYRTAIALCAQAAGLEQEHRNRAESSRDVERVRAHASSGSSSPREDDLQLKQLLPRPTHTSFRATLHRLYLDRSLAFAGSCLSLATLGAPGGVGLAARACLAASAAYAAASILRRGNRYKGHLEEALREGAQALSSLTGAEQVVFGHTHTQERIGSYANLGTFGIAAEGTRCWGRTDERGRLFLEQGAAD